jgi:hypothetical protein
MPKKLGLKLRLKSRLKKGEREVKVGFDIDMYYVLDH